MANSGTTVIDTRELSKQYNSVKVLDSLNLQVPKNSIFGFLGPVVLVLLFYLTLVLMLWVLFDQRPVILGITFAVMFGGSLLATFVPQLSYVLPLDMQRFGLALSQGKALPAVAIIQMSVTAGASILFTAVALWRFERAEF
jgi:hypothetical protein